jgi:hypothetical protein
MFAPCCPQSLDLDSVTDHHMSSSKCKALDGGRGSLICDSSLMDGFTGRSWELGGLL